MGRIKQRDGFLFSLGKQVTWTHEFIHHFKPGKNLHNHLVWLHAHTGISAGLSGREPRQQRVAD